MATDYADFGALQALQNFITGLNLASTSLQASAAQISAAIAAAGVPLLANPAGVYTNTNNLSIPAGGSAVAITDDQGRTWSPMAGYLSYEIFAQATVLSGTVAPFLTFGLVWYLDNAGAFRCYEEFWTVPLGTSGLPQPIATGPVRGAWLEITVINEDAANAVTLNKFKFFGNSRPAPEQQSDWRNTTIGAGVPGYTVPTAGQNRDGVLGIWSGTLVASGTAKLIAGLYFGQALLGFNVSGTSPDLTVQPQAYVHGSGLQNIDQFFEPGPTAHSGSTPINIPRSPLILALTNNNAANSVTYAISAIATPR